MQDGLLSTLIAVIAGLVAVGLFTIPAVVSFGAQLAKPEPKEDDYEDPDGKSTPEAVASYSAKVPKTLIFLFAALGCSTSIAVAVVSLITKTETGIFLEAWLTVATWVRLPCFASVRDCLQSGTDCF
jgi:hypothetical protein